MISSRVSGLHHVSINVDDLAATEAFYASVFGFEVIDRPDLGFDGRWFDMGNGLQLHLIVARVPGDWGQHFAISVDDVGVCHTALAAAGLDPSPIAPVGDLCQFFVLDPSGNRVEVNGPA